HHAARVALKSALACSAPRTVTAITHRLRLRLLSTSKLDSRNDTDLRTTTALRSYSQLLDRSPCPGVADWPDCGRRGFDFLESSGACLHQGANMASFTEYKEGYQRNYGHR